MLVHSCFVWSTGENIFVCLCAVSAAAAAARCWQGAAKETNIVPVVSDAVVAATVCAVVGLLQ